MLVALVDYFTSRDQRRFRRVTGYHWIAQRLDEYTRYSPDLPACE